MAYTPPGQTRQKVYEYVRDQLLAGRPPTVRDVQRAFGFRAVESSRMHMEALVKQGLLAKDPGRVARPYHLPEEMRRAGGLVPVFVPVVGRVQAGDFTTALQEPEGYVAVQSRLPREELFALRVRGDSMKNAGILHGDTVIVHRRPTARSGEIVVALVGEEATVKRLKIGGGRVELLPENPDFSPIAVDPEELRLLGKVVEVRRDLEHPPRTPAAPKGPKAPRRS